MMTVEFNVQSKEDFQALLEDNLKDNTERKIVFHFLEKQEELPLKEGLYLNNSVFALEIKSDEQERSIEITFFNSEKVFLETQAAFERLEKGEIEEFSINDIFSNSTLPLHVQEYIKNLLLNRISKIKSFGYEYPVDMESFKVTRNFIAKYKVHFVKSGNTPFVEIEKINGTFSSFSTRSNQRVSFLDGKLRMNIKHLDRFMGDNDIKSKDVLAVANSYDHFYGYRTYSDNEVFFINPTKTHIDEWWNLDCPDFYRFEINKSSSENGFGLQFVYWENKLIESSWSGAYVDEDITEEEARFLSQGKENTVIAKEIQRVLASKKVSDKDAEKVIDRAIEIVDQIQECIDRNSEEILMKSLIELNKSEIILDEPYGSFKEKLNEGLINKEEMEDILAKNNIVDLNKNINENPIQVLKDKISEKEVAAFDCGWIYFRFRDEEKDELLKNAYANKNKLENKEKKEKVSFYNGEFCLNLLWNGQSTTLKRVVAEFASKIIQKELNYSLSLRTVLD